MERYYLALGLWFSLVVFVAGMKILFDRLSNHAARLRSDAPSTVTVLRLCVCATLAAVMFGIQKQFSDGNLLGRLFIFLSSVGLTGCVYFGLVFLCDFLFPRRAKQFEPNKPSDPPRIILEKTAWPEQPIGTYQSAKGKWGYLVIYADHSFEFL